MEFRRQEQEEIYSPTPLQQSAFTRPLPSATSLLHVRGGRGAGEGRNGMGSLIQKPTPIAAAPAMAGALGSCGGGGGSGGSGMRLASTAISADSVTAADVDTSTLRYQECLRNHAATLGGHVLDGCCEFMPCADDALKCAACGCHRSFHRKETEVNSSLCDLQNGGAHGRVPLLLPSPHLPPPPTPHHHHGMKPFGSSGVLLHTGNSTGAISFGAAAAATESSSEELMAGASQRQFTVSRKRFRTKFTAEQKERMLAFAEKTGWRMQRQGEGVVEQFCAEVGISRQVLKVWMHNNKSSARKQPEQQQPLPPPQPPQEEEEVEQRHHELPEDREI